jgi:hypothetical protein
MKRALRMTTAGVVLVMAALVLAGVRGDEPGRPSASEPRDAVTTVLAPLAPAAAADHAAVVPAWLVPEGPPRRVAGRVLLAGHAGAPAAGARVRLAGVLSDAGLRPVAEAHAGPDGRFDLGAHPAAVYRVAAWLPGRAPVRMRVDARGRRRAPSDELTLVLAPCEHLIHGVVSDRDGFPVRGARVAAFRDAAAIETDEEGAYEQCVAGGTTALSVDAPGRGDLTVTAAVRGRTRVDVTLEGGLGVLAGAVLRVEDGAPVPSALIEISPAGPEPVAQARRTVLSDEAGRFRIGGLRAGRLRLEVTAASARTTDFHEVDVAASGVAETTVLVESMAAIRGTVRDERGAPVAGMLIQARTAGQTIVADDGVTGAHGTFTLARVARTEVTLAVEDHQVVAPASLRVEGPLAGVEVRVEGAVVISGRVHEDGVPVTGIAVLARPQQPGASEAALRHSSVLTGAGGAFELVVSGPGTYVLSARRSSGVVTAQAQVELAPGEMRREVELDLSGGGRLAGVVVDERGAAVIGARVELLEGSPRPPSSDPTDAEGRFRVVRLEGGVAYRPRVRDGATGQTLAPVTAHAPIRLHDDQTQILDARLVVRAGRRHLAGVIVDTAGAPVAGATVIARHGVLQVGATTSDAAGAFALEGILAGRYELLAMDPGRARHGRSVQIDAGRDDVRLVLEAAGAFELHLSGFADRPEVRVQSVLPPLDTLTVALEPGATTARVRDLRPGVYVVSAQAGGEQAITRVQLGAGAVVRVQLAAGGSGTVRVLVVDADGGRVAGSRCRATARAGDVPVIGAGGAVINARTDDEGTVTFAAPAGELHLACTGPRAIGGRSFSLARGEAATVGVVLERAAAVPPELWEAGLELDAHSLAPRVADVLPGGPAAVAGLRPGDLIQAIDGVPVGAGGRLAAAARLAGREAGSSVALTTTRGFFRLTLR